MIYSQHFTFHWQLLGLVSRIQKSGTGDNNFGKWKALRNRACRNASLVNANFSVNQMCPIICRWKRYCFGDNRRTKITERSSYAVLKRVA